MDDNGKAAIGERFSYSVVASPLHDKRAVEELTTTISAPLREAGGRPGSVTDDGQQPHLFLVATGGTERAVLDLVERRRQVQPAEPTLLVAHGDQNSLPAALETLAALQQAGARGRVVYLDGSAADRDTVDRAVSDLEAILRFRSTRLGLVGGPSHWLVASSPPAEVVSRRWGPRVEIVDPARMVPALGSAESARTVELASRFSTGAAGVTAVAIGEAAAIGTALDDVVTADGLDAVAVRCFDLLGDAGTSGCLALATLNDAGVVAGCEGDLPSTLAMMWIRFLLDQPAWMANPARVDPTSNELVLAHCTVAPSMVDGFSLSTHFESGIGVGISGHFASQPVTLVRIGGRDLEELWIAEGRITSTGHETGLCRTQVTVELTGCSVVELLEHPLGNHLVLAAGHHQQRLQQWWSLAIDD